MLIWVTHEYWARREGRGVLFKIGPPIRVEFFAEGRKAERDEIMASIDSGMPHLREMAEKDGPEAIRELDEKYNEALALVPA